MRFRRWPGWKHPAHQSECRNFNSRLRLYPRQTAVSQDIHSPCGNGFERGIRLAMFGLPWTQAQYTSTKDPDEWLHSSFKAFETLGQLPGRSAAYSISVGAACYNVTWRKVQNSLRLLGSI